MVLQDLNSESNDQSPRGGDTKTKETSLNNNLSIANKQNKIHPFAINISDSDTGFTPINAKSNSYDKKVRPYTVLGKELMSQFVF